MKQNKRLNLVLALIIAFSGWLYVIYNVDPVTTKTYRDVSIEYKNEDQLLDRGIAFRSADLRMIEVTVQAKRSVLNTIHEGDIRAVVDLADAGEGENTMELAIRKPDHVKVTSQDRDHITVVTEKSTRKTVHARAEYAADNGELEPYVTEQSIEDFEVQGAKSLVRRVSYVRLPIDPKKTSGKERTFSLNAVAMDARGKEVPHVFVSPRQASVTVVSSKRKTVPLVVHVDNASDEDYLRTYQAPKEVTIKGSEKALQDVDKIHTDTIPIDDMTKSGEKALTYDLPEGIQIANRSMDLTLSVKVTPYETKNIRIPAKDMDIDGVSKKHRASIQTDEVTVKVKDIPKHLDEISAENVKVTVDASGLGTGGYTLKAEVTSDPEVHELSMSNPYVYVIIDKK